MAPFSPYLKEGKRRQQTSSPGAQFSSAAWRVTVNNSLRRRVHCVKTWRHPHTGCT